MGRFYRHVGYLYAYEGDKRIECVGCCKLWRRANCLKICIQFNAGLAAEGEGVVYAVSCVEGNARLAELATIRLHPLTREYSLCVDLCTHPACQSAWMGILLQWRGESYLYSSIGEERVLRLGEIAYETWTERMPKQERGRQTAAGQQKEAPEHSLPPEQVEDLADAIADEAFVRDAWEAVEAPGEKSENAWDSLHRLFYCRPIVRPFRKSPYWRCVRISLADWKEYGIRPELAENSFLQHSYYRYRHLILSASRTMEGWQYRLMLPGVYNAREKYMAEMYGFSSFLPLDGGKERENGFGYWYLLLQGADHPRSAADGT